MKEWIRRFAAGTVLCASLWGFAEAAPPKVPEDVYQWVQSSSRKNYFFNKQAIAYGVDAQGKVDINVLLVPVIKTYDDLWIKDIRDKREWRRESTAALADLAGEADYLTFDIAKQTVTVDVVDLIDSYLSTIEHSEPKEVVDISKLTEKSLDGIFYRAILDYEKEHRPEILSHTKGELREKDRKYIESGKKRLEEERKEKEKKHEKELREAKKRLEQEQREEKKQLEKEQREAMAQLEKKHREAMEQLEKTGTTQP